MVGATITTLGRVSPDQRKDRAHDVAVLCLSTFAFFTLVPLPPAYYPDFILGRPEELVSALFFGYALRSMWRHRAWQNGAFERGLMVSVLVDLVGEAVYMPRSYRLFDAMFEAAHLLKVVSYVAVVVGLLMSVDELYRTEAGVAAELRTMALGVEHPADGIAIFDLDWKLSYLNSAYREQTGWSEDRMLSQSSWEMQFGEAAAEIQETLRRGETWSGSHPSPTLQGRRIEATIAPVKDGDGTVTSYVAVIRDVTEQRQLVRELRGRATVDSLTGLPNRSQLFEMLEDLVASRPSVDRQGACCSSMSTTSS